MAKYATVDDVEAGFREFDADEKVKCNALLEEAAAIIDAFAKSAGENVKKIVSCRMVRRAIGDGADVSSFPIGSTQGSMSALGYSQTWTLANGANGELYLAKLEKSMLGIGNRACFAGPLDKVASDD